MTTGGEVLAEACVIYECDYCDVNGELPYTYNLTRLHDRSAGRREGALWGDAWAFGGCVGAGFCVYVWDAVLVLLDSIQ